MGEEPTSATSPAARLRDLVSDLDPQAREEALAAVEALEADRARALDEAQELAYVASHDLTEPLRMVRSYVGLLERRCGEQIDDRGREFMFHAVDGAERGQQLIDGLLRFSRVSTRASAPEEVDVGSAVADVLRPLGEDVPVRVEGPLGTVHADPAQLRQLLSVLVDNALTYVAPGVGPDVVVRRTGPAIEVADNGIGIPSRDRERVFRVFGRLHSREDFPGVGVGLAVARRIAERHGGRLTVESVPGEGSVFRVVLPGAP